MRILIVSAECAPVAKVGGLGDFVHGLARALIRCGDKVEVFLPKYDVMPMDQIGERHVCFTRLKVPHGGNSIDCDIEHGTVDGIGCYLVDPRSPYDIFRRGRIYGELDDIERFAFLSRAVLEYVAQSSDIPDIIHINDWQTALVPVLLFESYQTLGTRCRVCLTVHNLGHQGIADTAILNRVGLDHTRLMTPDRLRDPSDPRVANLLKGGIVFSNFVTTVSPRYAWEAMNTEQGKGLQATLDAHRGKFVGILNGIDDSTWNPQTDPYIARHYDEQRLPEKAYNRAVLRARFGLNETLKPLIVVISRLDDQKGVDLIRHAIEFTLANGCQFFLLGSAPDPQIGHAFAILAEHLGSNPDCHLELCYDNVLAHQVYAAADAIVIPSRYEPCGLTQMIAMRYGAVPIVRRVGGLYDTVFDANHSDRPFEERNGFAFDEDSVQGLESALGRAIGLWFEHPEYFRQLRINGMRQDHSWHRSAERYREIYERIRV